MKQWLAGFVLLIGCASSTRYVNVAQVRNEISSTIARDPAPSRHIVSMGHTTHTAAVVYTQTTDNSLRREETWVRSGDGWKLEESREIGATP
jgi:hypothetical protein